MFNATIYPSRRKPGTEETPYLPFDSKSKTLTPHGRRRQLLRSLRAHPDLPSNGYRVLESQLERIAVSDPSLITWDSIKSGADEAGLSQRSLIFARKDLAERGMQIRLKPSELEAWLEAVGKELGFRYPERAERPRMFTIMLIHLSPEDARRARVAAFGEDAERARIDNRARNNCQSGSDDERAKSVSAPSKDCAQTSTDLARSLPISEFGSIESGSLNRKGDGSLDPGGEKSGEGTPADGDSETIAELEKLAASPVPSLARLGRAGLARLGRYGIESPAAEPPALTPTVGPVETIGPPPEPVAPADLGQLRAMTAQLAADHAIAAPAPPSDAPSQPCDWIRELPDAPASKVASVARALMDHFHDWNELTEKTFRLYLDRVRIGIFPADLVAGLVKDACEPGRKRPSHQFSKALADEWKRLEDRSPGLPGKMPGDRL